LEDAADALLVDAIAQADQAAQQSAAIDALCARAELALLADNIGSAAQLFAEALVRARIAGNQRARVRPLIGLGDIAGLQSSTDEALHHYHDAFDVARAYEDEGSVIQVLERLAVLGVSSRIVPALLRLIGLADAMRERLGVGRSTFDERRITPRLQHARKLLGEDEFARIHAEGQGLSLAQVVAEFDTGARWHAPATAQKGLHQPRTIDQLTRREREVVQQISKGYTNRQIAANLGMAERTVDSHVGNIRQKLQLPSRARIAVWAVANGLSSPD
jgi:DNA-binding CsgD family transcriptional regulator